MTRLECLPQHLVAPVEDDGGVGEGAEEKMRVLENDVSPQHGVCAYNVIYVYMYICIYVHIYMYIHTHIYIYTY